MPCQTIAWALQNQLEHFVRSLFRPLVASLHLFVIHVSLEIATITRHCMKRTQSQVLTISNLAVRIIPKWFLATLPLSLLSQLILSCKIKYVWNAFDHTSLACTTYDLPHCIYLFSIERRKSRVSLFLRNNKMHTLCHRHSQVWILSPLCNLTY